LRPELGIEPAYERILSRWRRDRVPGGQLHVAALHANAREDAQWLLDRVNEQAEPKTLFLGEFGTVMIAHTGPGIVGLAWRWTTSAPDRGSCDRARGS
jgi:fatty acid-binding protein DegV